MKLSVILFSLYVHSPMVWRGYKVYKPLKSKNGLYSYTNLKCTPHCVVVVTITYHKDEGMSMMKVMSVLMKKEDDKQN